ncbi:MAG: hypothetical protein ACR2RV_09980, partial [Verrucomicrobiales bacterium]
MSAYLLGGVIDGLLALGFVWAVWFWQRERVPARVAWWLFVLVLVKCVIPLELPVYLPEGSRPGALVAVSEPELVLGEGSELMPSQTQAGGSHSLSWLLPGGLLISLGFFCFRLMQTMRVVSRA